MNIWIDQKIFELQNAGGISRLWQQLTPRLHEAMPDATFDTQRPADVFLSTYYNLPPNGEKSVVLFYDAIHERYPGLGMFHPEAMQKRAAVARAAAVIAISQYSANDCLRFFGTAAHIAYCGGGEMLQRAAPEAIEAFRRKYGIDRPYVLLIGRRALYKNAHSLYEAWPLSKVTQHMMVIAVGGEPALASDQQFVSEHRWLQLALSDSELAAAYSGAYALVYPSYYEGFGLPILEALSCGCPVICGSESSEPEVAQDAAVYVNVCSPREIAYALDALADPASRLDLALKGYERAKLFRWDIMAHKVAEIIRGVA